jgi:hypothetical protein
LEAGVGVQLDLVEGVVGQAVCDLARDGIDHRSVRFQGDRDTTFSALQFLRSLLIGLGELLRPP